MFDNSAHLCYHTEEPGTVDFCSAVHLHGETALGPEEQALIKSVRVRKRKQQIKIMQLLSKITRQNKSLHRR